MALPTGPYQGQDLTNYEAGNRFLPRQFYSLNSPPSQIQTNTIGNTGGVTNTNVAQSYMGYPSYEAWLLAQGGGGGNGGGNDPVDNTNRGGINQNLGPTNITDYESEAYGVGPTWGGTWARAQDLYSKLPTPGNLIMKGIRHWKGKRDTRRAEEQQAAADQMRQEREASASQAAAQGRYDASVASGREGGGWYGGADYSGGKSGDVAQAGPGRDPSDRMAQGGRIGFKDGKNWYDRVYPFDIMPWPLKDLSKHFSQVKGKDPSTWFGGLTRKTYNILADRNKILADRNKAEGGRIGYRWGESVDPEEPAEDINSFMQDQGIAGGEMVEGNHPFDLRIQELMGKGMSYEDAYDIAEMEFQDLFAAQEGPEQEQGIARLL